MRPYYLWLVASLLCLAYFFALCVAMGFDFDFDYIWLFGFFACGAVFLAIHGTHLGWWSLPKWLKLGFVILFGIGCIYFTFMEILVASALGSTPADGAEYIIVLGAHVNGDVISMTLKQRLDAAYEYATRPANENARIIVTGGQGHGEDLPEGDAMKAYLVGLGIDDERILVENLSANTDENLDNSIKLYISNTDDNLVIVSSNFHMYRALRLARAKKLKNSQGLAAPCTPWLLATYMVREAVGITKELVFGNF